MANLDGYVGGSEDQAKIRRLSKKRDAERKAYEAQAKAGQERLNAAGLRQFSGATTEALEHAFKNETIGLVTKAEFVQKRVTLQERMEEELRRKQHEEEEAAKAERERKRREKERAAGKPKLSFADHEGAEEEEDEEDGQAPLPKFSFAPRQPAAEGEPAAAAAAAAGGSSTAAEERSGDKAGPSGRGEGSGDQPLPKKAKFGKLTKNPDAPTDFLPDRQREKQADELRERLKREWTETQDKIKAEALNITYSYWDGQGHRRDVNVKKGDTIGQFLKAVRDQLGAQFRELRGVSVDNLMYIKEDIILPQHVTFYELIINKARGKSGPLFDFGVHEDVRVVNDASKEKTDTHAGKVVERHWYERNKHIFPANRWEMYDPDKDFSTYTVHDYVEKH